MRLHAHAAGLFFVDDPDWRRKLWRGGLTVLTPFVGWHIVLGYRRHLIRHLIEGPSVLPEWRGNTLRHFVDGLKASCVIFGYLAPLYVIAFAVAASRGFDAGDLSLWIPAVFVALPFLLPVSLPFALFALTREEWLRPAEAVSLAAAFALVVFVVPAAFLQVSRTGRFRSAFDLAALVAFLRWRFAAYSRAWLDSIPLALAAHLALPIAPWSVVWAYCSVMFLFNEVLVMHADPGASGWILHTRHDARWTPADRLGLRTLEDARGEGVLVLDLGNFSAPLPWKPAGRPIDA